MYLHFQMQFWKLGVSKLLLAVSCISGCERSFFMEGGSCRASVCFPITEQFKRKWIKIVFSEGNKTEMCFKSNSWFHFSNTDTIII